MSGWTDLAAFQMRNAMYASADAQERLVQEQARSNEILRQSELSRNKELERQFNKEQERAKRERQAKAILVKAEITLEENDYSNLSIEEISSLIGELSSLVNFAETNGLLDDLFQEIDDIRFAHKTITTAKSNLEKARNQHKILLDQEAERATKAYYEELSNDMSRLIDHYEKEKDNMEQDGKSLKERLYYYTSELFDAHWFLYYSDFIDPEFKSNDIFDKACKETRSYILRISEKIDDNTFEEIKNLQTSLKNWCKIYNNGSCLEALKPFKPRNFDEFNGMHLCPVCDAPLNMTTVHPKAHRTRNADMYLIHCGEESSVFPEGSAENFIRYDKSSSKSHFVMSTFDTEIAHFFLESNKYHVKAKTIETQKDLDIKLEEAQQELENSNFFGRSSKKREIRSLKLEMQTSNRDLEGAIKKIDDDLHFMSAKIETVRKKNRKLFNTFVRANKENFLSCFGKVPDDSEEAKFWIFHRLAKYQSLVKPNQDFQWTFTQDWLQTLIEAV